MPRPDQEEQAHYLKQEEAELRRRMADVAAFMAATEEKVAETLEQVAQHRSPPDAERLRAKAEEARHHAAKERNRAARYRVRGDDDQASRASRREQISQRILAIHTRVDELPEQRQGDALPAISSDRLAAAQQHAATSQDAARQATGA